MALFRRKPKTIEENPPKGLDDLHSFRTPSAGSPIVPAHYGGPDGWAPKQGPEFPAVPQQDERLIHYYQPKPDVPEVGKNNQWYLTRNRANVDRKDAVEHNLTLNQGGQHRSDESNPAPVSNQYDGRKFQSTRPTAYLNPAPTRMLIEQYGIYGMPRHLNGTHFSMASNRRTYPIGGQNPQKRFRNTYRLDPGTNGNRVMDVDGDTVTGVPAPTIYVSPMSSSQYGRAFRLG